MAKPAHGAPAWMPVLAALSSGRWVSGEQLARELGVSRTAVWKQVRRLGSLGIEVEQRRGRGYRLETPIELLDRGAILAEIQAAGTSLPGELHILAEADSTNSWLYRMSLPMGNACLAELQTGGRGRRGRSWISAPGRDLCLSLVWDFDQGLGALAGMSVAIGVGVAGALVTEGAEIGLKWPNDLLVGDAKIGGILIEATGEAAGACRAVIGIGINLDLGDRLERIDQPCTDLKRVLGRMPGRNRLAGRVLTAAVGVCRRFERHGLAPFLEAWGDRDALRGRDVVIDSGEQRFIGRAAGVDDRGRLLVDTDAGRRAVSGGEVSVRMTDAV